MRKLAVLLMLGSGLFVARVAAAHHSFAAYFDGEKVVSLTGERGVDEPALSLLDRRRGCRRRSHALALRGLSAEHARAAGLAARRDPDGRNHGYRRRLGRAYRAERRGCSLGNLRRRAQARGGAAGRHGRELT